MTTFFTIDWAKISHKVMHITGFPIGQLATKMTSMITAPSPNLGDGRMAFIVKRMLCIHLKVMCQISMGRLKL